MFSPHIELLLQLACIDGEASPEELTLIREIGASEHVTCEALENALTEMDPTPVAGNIGDLELSERIRMVVNLILVIKADGRIEPEEMAFSLPVVRKLGVDPEAFSTLIMEVMDRELVHAGYDLTRLVTSRFFTTGYSQEDHLGFPRS